ncbi:hypothetical protein D9615_005838 [Tricholomella constricta]|uniref:Uncharacterized protein n=1 Tax=Tricholomella constricta TaxID=117010 RepID=A0A8H5M3T2_9AGAR|nr:hypothetical protein D9615_005838 [Tricholomella constricta]
MSSSTGAYASFQRALSPHTLAVTQPVEDVKSAQASRYYVYIGCNSVNDVIDAVPADYRDCLREPLKALAATVSRLAATRSTIAKWEALKDAGQVPPHMRVKPLEVQFTKDFAGDARAAEATRNIVEANRKYQDSVRDLALEAKRIEARFLQEATDNEPLFKLLSPSVIAAFADVKSRYMRPRFDEVMGEPTAAGNIELAGWESDPEVEKVWKNLLKDLPLIARRVITIVEQIERQKASKVAKKRDLADTATVEMGDITAESIQKMVQKHLEAERKKQEAPKKKLPNFKKDGKNRSSSSKTARSDPNKPMKAWTAKTAQKKKAATSKKNTSKGKGKGKAPAK